MTDPSHQGLALDTVFKLQLDLLGNDGSSVALLHAYRDGKYITCHGNGSCVRHLQGRISSNRPGTQEGDDYENQGNSLLEVQVPSRELIPYQYRVRHHDTQPTVGAKEPLSQVASRPSAAQR